MRVFCIELILDIETSLPPPKVPARCCEVVYYNVLDRLTTRFLDKIILPFSVASRGHPDGEPVLLVHGRQDSLSIFEPLIEEMSDQYYYVAIDMPGNGLSDAFPHGEFILCKP